MARFQYNTCMDVVQTGVPALVLPFSQNREQRFRAERLSTRATLKVLADDELVPDKITELMRQMIRLPRKEAAIDLDGAGKTLSIIETWQKEKGRNL